MQTLKIAVIGGGSSYTPELIEGIILRHQQIPVTELALVDVKAQLKCPLSGSIKMSTLISDSLC